MEQHEVDMVLKILEMFKNQKNAEQDMLQRVLLMGAVKEKEYLQKVPEIEHE